MDKRWESYLQKQVERSREVGPYYAIGVVQDICEGMTTSAGEKIKHISYFLDQLMVNPGKEA